LLEKRVAALHEARQKLYQQFRETYTATATSTLSLTWWRAQSLAWFLATAFDPELRDPQLAVEMARKAAALAPDKHQCLCTLGIALYRAGEPKAAVETLQKAVQIQPAVSDFFFLAMAYWQLGDREQARKWYDQAVHWMDEDKPTAEETRYHAAGSLVIELKGKKGVWSEETRRFRDEAAALLASRTSRHRRKKHPSQSHPGRS
jgi:Flp pilus assembly protein TadD